MIQKAIYALAGSLALLAGLLLPTYGAEAASMITGKQIKDNTVTHKDIKDGTIKLKDLSPKVVKKYSS